MSKLMIVLGILAAAIGVAVALLGFFSPGAMQVRGLTTEVAAILLMGGILAAGLGAILDAVDEQRRTLRDLADSLMSRGERTSDRLARTIIKPIPEPPPVPSAMPPRKPAIMPEPEPQPAPEPKTPIFAGAARVLEAARERAGIKTAESKLAAEQVVAETKISTRETIIAIEKAKADLEGALGGGMASPPPKIEPEPAPEPEVEPPPEEEPELLAETELEATSEEGDDEQLYVMEEKLISGRPARVLSDGTVEAETDEGWMRFENLEHLEEYLEAMSPAKNSTD